MTTVRKITPKETPLEVKHGGALKPFTGGFEEFMESFPHRWMGSFLEPFGWRRPMWRDFETFAETMFPHVDLIDHEADLLVRAEVPGVRKEDLDIELIGDRLTIKAVRELKEEEKSETFFRSEMEYGTLRRTIRLPVEVDMKKAKAMLEDGILEIVLPKVEVLKRHTIKVA